MGYKKRKQFDLAFKKAMQEGKSVTEARAIGYAAASKKLTTV